MLAQIPARLEPVLCFGCTLPCLPVFACLPCPAVQLPGWLALLAPRALRESQQAPSPIPSSPLRHPPPPSLPAGAALAEGIDPCAAVELENYNLGLHIGSVFILLGVSLAGAMLPVLLHISSKSSIVLTCVKMGTYFGACRGWGWCEAGAQRNGPRSHANNRLA